MPNREKSRAEQLFSAAQKPLRPVPTAKEVADREMAERVAKQRALRLAKEAADKDAAEAASIGKKAAKDLEPSPSTVPRKRGV